MPASNEIYWERVSPTWWSASVGYVVQERLGVWTAHVYRNTSSGRAWTERRTGFATIAAAKRWVEHEAEE